jgi:hypothetical protein
MVLELDEMLPLQPGSDESSPHVDTLVLIVLSADGVPRALPLQRA